MVASYDIKGHFYMMERSHLIDCYSLTLGVTICYITSIYKDRSIPNIKGNGNVNFPNRSRLWTLNFLERYKKVW